LDTRRFWVLTVSLQYYTGKATTCYPPGSIHAAVGSSAATWACYRGKPCTAPPV